MKKELIYEKISGIIGETITGKDASELFSPELIAIIITAVEIIDFAGETIAQCGVLDDIANLQRQYYIALKDAGFTSEEALSILIHTKLPSKK